MLSQPGSIVCPECCLEFESGSHLATHMAHAHSYISSAREYVAGTTCRWCLRQYWSVARAREHLAAGSLCLAMLVASIAPLRDEELDWVDKLHVEQRHVAKKHGGAVSSLRLPPVQCHGPRRPVPPDLAACLSVELHSLSSFARSALWRSTCAAKKLGLLDVTPALEALEPVPLSRAFVSPPPLNPNGLAWIDHACASEIDIDNYFGLCILQHDCLMGSV